MTTTTSRLTGERALGLDHARSRDFVRQRATAIRGLAKRAAADIVQIGQMLSEVKERLEHGQWLPWLKAEFGWSADTAQNFLRVFGKFKNRNFRNLDIDISCLYLLAAPKTEDGVRDRVMERAELGEPITREIVAAEERRERITLPPVLMGWLQDAGRTVSGRRQ